VGSSRPPTALPYEITGVTNTLPVRVGQPHGVTHRLLRGGLAFAKSAHGRLSGKKRQLLSTVSRRFCQLSGVFYCSGYEQLRANGSSLVSCLFLTVSEKWEKIFSFLRIGVSLQSSYRWPHLDGKSLKTGLRRWQNRVIQPKPVTLAAAVLFRGAALSHRFFPPPRM
jgi:hypothetical protein